MTIRNFFTPDDVCMMKNNTAAKEEFEIKKTCKGKKNAYTVTFLGRHIAKDLADNIWRGNDYLFHCQFDYHGQMGIGGKGWATEVFPMLRSWDDFKDWLDKQLKTWPEYETEEYGQMCLF